MKNQYQQQTFQGARPNQGIPQQNVQPQQSQNYRMPNQPQPHQQQVPNQNQQRQQQVLNQQQQVQQRIQQQQMQKEQMKDARQQLQQIYEKTNAYDFDEELFKIAPELHVMKKLLDYENTVDKMIKRKRFDMQEQFAKPIPQLKHVMRIAVSSQFQTEEGKQTFENPTHWVLKLEGKLLTDNIELVGKYRTKKFTSFFSSIELSVDPDIYPNQQKITWKKKENTQDVDAIVIKREGNLETEICLDFHIHHNPPQYKVHKSLANIIGVSICTRAQALASIWEYIKMQNLQDRDNKNQINNDDAMKEIFNCEKMQIGTITQRLRDLLEVDDPITIRTNLSIIPQVKVYDIQVDVPYPFGLEIMPFLSQKVVIDDKKETVIHPFMQLNQKIKKLDKKSMEYLERLKSHKYKRDSYMAYSLQPSQFIENILIQQNQLLKIMKQQNVPQFNDPNKLSYLIDNEDEVMNELKNILEDQEQRMAQQQVAEQNPNNGNGTQQHQQPQQQPSQQQQQPQQPQQQQQ